ncbi:hypothetical protein M758_UG058600 [Ceratodon purpureus]|nr:hypothetical protein M758_UG058600 [Ceratodon purpureus]
MQGATSSKVFKNRVTNTFTYHEEGHELSPDWVLHSLVISAEHDLPKLWECWHRQGDLELGVHLESIPDSIAAGLVLTASSNLTELMKQVQ